jgi:A/G-specific adenine glycosylase
MATTPFTAQLLKWHRTVRRKLPWKKTKDPYKIWLSEIILQQTRVEQGIPYYEKLIGQFPDVKRLAAASEDEVLHAWQGLGYYSRARNLHAAAKHIVTELNGEFPQVYEEILKLKGVGEYTAAAIASFAFDLPYAVVDGNVYRVLSRAFGITDGITSAKGKRKFATHAQKLLDSKRPAAFNQALMDFGALVCTPANPSCTRCFFRRSCFAYQRGLVNSLPVKKNKAIPERRWFNYMIAQKGDQLAIEKRTDDDIWKGLYQFPMLESDGPVSSDRALSLAKATFRWSRRKVTIEAESDVIEHRLSHQILMARFFHLKFPRHANAKRPANWVWVKRKDLKKFAFPKLIEKYSRKYLA